MQVDFTIFNQSGFYHVVQDVLLFPNIFLFLVEGLLKWTFKDVFHKHDEKRFGTFMRCPQCGKRNLRAAAC